MFTYPIQVWKPEKQLDVVKFQLFVYEFSCVYIKYSTKYPNELLPESAGSLVKSQ